MPIEVFVICRYKLAYHIICPLNRLRTGADITKSKITEQILCMEQFIYVILAWILFRTKLISLLMLHGTKTYLLQSVPHFPGKQNLNVSSNLVSTLSVLHV